MDGLSHYCKDCTRAMERDYNKRTQEERSIYRRKYYRKNQEKLKAYASIYNSDTERAERRADLGRSNYLKNRSDRLKAAKEFRSANRDRIRNWNTARKALLKGVTGLDFTAAQWIAMRIAYDGRCAYCGVTPDVLTQDHIIPLSKGGNHTADNIVPACQPCNSRKGAKNAPPRIIVPHAAP